jgi:hypothetical protein
VSSDGTIDCGEHGVSRYCIICVHLREGSGLEYFANPACDHGPAQAWCRQCDDVVASHQGWTDESEKLADPKLFCQQCYRRTLGRHHFVAYARDPDETCDWTNLGPPDS